ncbi:HAD-like domain-containing protein [Xylariomycetidae sp. FL0641]|nr:HAD-like domain-containing protein [Xylariomycetidae sp. FL0641]
MPPNTLFLDLGGVLLTYDPSAAAPAVPPRTTHALLASAEWAAYERGATPQATCYADLASRHPGLAGAAAVAAAIDAVAASATLNAPLVRLVAALRARRRHGVQVFPASNIPAEGFARVRGRLPADLFDGDAAAFTSAALRVRKPQPEFYAAVLRAARVPRPGDAVFVDDRAENVEGAKRAGMHGVLYTGVEGLAGVLDEVFGGLEGDGTGEKGKEREMESLGREVEGAVVGS